MMPHWKSIREERDWIHEFIDSPDGPSVSRVCEVDGRIVGHNGLILMQMTVGGKTVLGGKAEGAVVSEEFHKAAAMLTHLPPKDRPIFLNLSRQLWESAMARDVAIMFGLPTRMALYGHLKAGWELWLLQEQGLIRPINVFRSARLLSEKVGGRRRSQVMQWALAIPLWVVTRFLRPAERRGKHSVIPVDSFDERVDRLWQSLAERHGMISIRRTSRHLNWRFAHDPYVRAILVADGQLKGYGIAVTRDGQEYKELQIIDLVLDDGHLDCLGQILGGLIEQAGSKIDYVTVNCFTSGCGYGAKLNKQLRKYFLPATGVRSKTAILKVNPVHCDEATVKDPNNWFINAIFTEVF
ncbi:MAG: hypothetical protein QUS33_00670 [Dehalococcoidia bacterium]|nr:hypothetical protein [Dehalococcoidia bacterium]